jgi:hypothetical protein
VGAARTGAFAWARQTSAPLAASSARTSPEPVATNSRPSLCASPPAASRLSASGSSGSARHSLRPSAAAKAATSPRGSTVNTLPPAATGAASSRERRPTEAPMSALQARLTGSAAARCCIAWVATPPVCAHPGSAAAPAARP